MLAQPAAHDAAIPAMAPHVVVPEHHSCEMMWQALTGSCSFCDTGAELLAHLGLLQGVACPRR